MSNQRAGNELARQLLSFFDHAAPQRLVAQ
jgi:hypothetical protein